MAKTPFKLRSQGSSFKMMGSSPIKQEDDFTERTPKQSKREEKVLEEYKNKTTDAVLKWEQSKNEAIENKDKGEAKNELLMAKENFGKDSKEALTKELLYLKAKEADRQGYAINKEAYHPEDGSYGRGKKQLLFRKLSTKINQIRQKKVQKKIDELN